MAYTSIDNPELYFQTKLYTGNGSARSITFDGSADMQPDWVWIKARSDTWTSELFDSVRGVTKSLTSSTTNSEGTSAQDLTAFNSNGFSIGTNGGINNNADTYASWNWKAGTSFTNDASSTSVGSRDSAGTVSTTAGISITGWTGDDGADTLAHGLGVAPKWYILKSRGQSGNWIVYHHSLGAAAWIELDVTDAKSTSGSQYRFNDTAPTSTVFSVGATGAANDDEGMIAYIFAEKQGFSKFGKYTGNGDADGTFVHLGFKPAWVMTKCTSNSGTGWHMQDNKRDGFNYNNHRLFSNASGGEETTVRMDLLSNGFKYRDGDGNGNGREFIYMAFAESPLVTSSGVPGNAR